METSRRTKHAPLKPTLMQTSLQAYRSVRDDGTASDHRRKILTALEMFGSANAYMLAERLSLRKEQVGRRMSELLADGKIYDTGLTALTDSKRQSIVYDIVKGEKG